MSLQLQASAALELRRRRAAGVTTVSRYDTFRRTYFDDPVAFIHDCILWPAGRQPYPYQEANLADLVAYDRVSERGPHGLGKTAGVAWVIHWFALTRDGEDWKIPITASAWRQLQKYLWPEVHKWARLLNWSKIGRAPYDTRSELLSLNLKLRTGEAFTMASDNPELIEGAHGEHLLYIFDEAKAIPDATWDSAEGAFSVGSAKWLACSTPGEPQGRFYEIQSRKPGYDDWHTNHVTLDDCIAAGAIKPDWAEGRRVQWGESSPRYLNRVLGEFAEGAKDGLIPLSWIEQAQARWEEWRDAGFPGRMTSLGADIGGGEEGGDQSTIAPIYDGVKVRELRVQDVSDPNTSTMALVSILSGILEAAGRRMHAPANSILTVLDSIGVGLGALHRMRELGYNAHGFVASKSTELRDKSDEYGFADWRSAAWWLLREMLEPNSGFNVCLPPDVDTPEGKTDLTGDLTAPTYAIVSENKIRVESKEKLRVRLHRSTDDADAVLHGIVGPILLEEEQQAGREYIVYHGR